METNEQGLTKEEKIMFSILGIILIAAIGVLIINSFSSNERKLDDEKNNTPITETQGQKENIEDETITEEADDSLIEEIPVITTPVVEVESNTTSQNSTQNMNNSSNKPNNNKTEIKDEEKDEPTVEDKEEIEDTENKNDNEENEGTGSTDPSLIKWSLKDTIITEAYTNDTITLDKYVILDDGSEEEATVEVKKQDGESWNLVDTTTNQFTVTEGIYKYLYTYNEETKEVLLTVINKLELENISILTLAEQYNETASISEEDFNKLKHTIANTTLINDSNNYTLTITKDNNSSNLIPLVLTLKEETSIMFVASTINGLIPKVENAVWYQTLSNKDILLWVDLNQIGLSNSKMNININGTTYYFNLNIVVNTVQEDQPEIEDIPVEDTDNEDDKVDNPTNPEDEGDINTPNDSEETEDEKDTPNEETPTEDSKVEEDSQEPTEPSEETKEEEESNPTEEQVVEEEEKKEEPSDKDEPLPEGNDEPTEENQQELNSEYEENADSETHNIIQNDVVESTPITS